MDVDVKISVIVPVFNVQNYLRDCLDSIINQTFKDIEIVCINDGSTDESLNILNEYAQKDSRIIVYSQQNLGMSFARNSGLNIAKGRYISFIDSDDYLEKDFLELLYKKAISEDADIVASDVIYDENKVLSNKNFISKVTMKNSVKPIETLMDKYNFLKAVIVWNKIYKREFLEKNNIRFVNGCMFEDNAFTFVAITFATKILVETKAKYYYRITQNSISGRAFNTENVFDFIHIMDSLRQELLIYIDKKQISEDVVDMFEAFMINSFYNWKKSVSDIYEADFTKQIVERLKLIKCEPNSFIDYKTATRYCKMLNIPKWKAVFLFR